MTPDGSIHLVIPKSIIQNPGPGDSIATTNTSTRLGSPSGGTNETIPDLTGSGAYTLRPDNQCLPNTAPLALLTANINQGGTPLTVNFDASASTDPDVIDTIASYTFNFNEGGSDVTQGSPLVSHTFNASGEYHVKLVVTDSRGKVSSNTATYIVNALPPLTSVVSRKVHGAQTFDIDLPGTGTPGIECRSGGASNDYQMVFTFATNLTSVDTASVSSGVGAVSSRAIGPNPNQYTVNLTGVTNAQYVTVALGGVQDAAGANFGVAHRMAVLVGDTTANGGVNSSDIGQAKANSGQTANAGNFRTDVTVNGTINSSDIGTVKAESGKNLP